MAALLLSVVLLIPSPGSRAQERDTYLPYQVSVTTGTASGSLDDVFWADSSYYSVTETDEGTTASYSELLNPDGGGTYTQWDSVVGCGIGQNYLCVDEGPPTPGDGTSTYIHSSVDSWVVDTYSMDDSTYSPAGVDLQTIDDVTAYGTSSVGSSTPDTIGVYDVCLYSGTTLDCSPNGSLGIFWSELQNTWTTNPDDSAAWEGADLTNLECGHGAAITSGPNDPSSTLLYCYVHWQSTWNNYTTLFQYDWNNLDNRNKPTLHVTGYTESDGEDIEIQVLRGGTWTTIATTSLTSSYGTTSVDLNAQDVQGGVASVRILDGDNTDNTATTVYVDHIAIEGEGEPSNPMAAISVYTHSQYDTWANAVDVSLWWIQAGGPEPATVINRFLAVYVDEKQVGGGFIPAPGNRTRVGMPWNLLDGGQHNITVFGYVTVNWSYAGTQVYRSDGENLAVDNFARWAALVLVGVIAFLLIVATVVVVATNRYDEDGEA